MDALTPEFLTVDGVCLECRWIRVGGEDRPVLVFLHEGLGCVALWRDVPDRIARATGCDAFVWSRAGYGRSDACALPRPVRFMHEEGLNTLERVLDAAGIGRAILIGHSDGGSISLIHCGGTPAQRIVGLVTLAAHVFNEDLCVRSIEEVREAYATSDLRERLARHHGDNVDCAFRGWNDVWLHPDFRHWNLEEFLPGITVPALVIQGADDKYGTPAQAEAIARQIGGPVEKWMVPGCGHSPHIDAGDVVAERIAEFVRGLTDSAE